MAIQRVLPILATPSAPQRFSTAGSVDLTDMDTVEEGALTFDGAAFDLLREPDAVQWLDSERFVVANEGDYHGGSRGLTSFSQARAVLYETGAAFAPLRARAGHYLEGRPDTNGGEPTGTVVAESCATTNTQ